MPVREHLDYTGILDDLFQVASAIKSASMDKSAIALDDLSVGDEVRAQIRGGSGLRGPIQAIHPETNEVTVRGRRFPASSIRTSEDIESVAAQNLRVLKQREQETAEQARRDALTGPGRTPGKPQKAPIDFSGSPVLPILRNLNVDVRLYWQDFYDAFAREWAADHGVPIEGCVANRSGIRGGTEIQWGISGKVTISAPSDPADVRLLMDGLSAEGINPTLVDNEIIAYGYRVAAGLAKVGFPVHC
ncbi:MAG: hypothetical protein ABSH01_28760 [Terriglobia bacterium]|jgi:hypothetical protein